MFGQWFCVILKSINFSESHSVLLLCWMLSDFTALEFFSHKCVLLIKTSFYTREVSCNHCQLSKKDQPYLLTWSFHTREQEIGRLQIWPVFLLLGQSLSLCIDRRYKPLHFQSPIQGCIFSLCSTSAAETSETVITKARNNSTRHAGCWANDYERNNFIFHLFWESEQLYLSSPPEWPPIADRPTERLVLRNH